MSDRTERRSEPRIEQVRLIKIIPWPRAALSEPIDTGRTLDLSRHGLRLEVHLPIPVSSILTCRLAFGEEVVEVRGVVRHLQPCESNLYEIGLSFEKVDTMSQAVFDRYANRQEKESPRQVDSRGFTPPPP